MNKEQILLQSKMRLNAQISNKNWHVYPPAEEKLHTLEISQATVDANGSCAISRPEFACWCEPTIEDYTEQGGGTLIIHRQVCWQ